MRGQTANVRRWLVAGAMMLTGIVGAGPACASEVVRVSVAEHAQAVSLSASQSMVLEFPGGTRVKGGLRTTIEPHQAGLRVDGRVVGFFSVFVQTAANQLRVSIPNQAARTEWHVSGGVAIERRHGRLLVVNHVDVEAYVAGVVTGEINAGWHAQALRAQAVAARTYVLYKKMLNHDQPFDVVSSVQDQVYQGLAHVNAKVRDAVRDTQGQVITYRGRPILAAYSSTAAGPTEDAAYVWDVDVPYLKGVECPFDDASPRYRWEAAVPLRKIEQRLRQSEYPVGAIATMTPFSRTPSGRIDQLRILHSRGELLIRGQEFRRVVGYSTIYSTQFRIQSFGRELVFVGRGAGHGVGLCQWGMKEMAELGYSYDAILQYYYPGTEFLPLSRVTLSPPVSP